jgi:hypothetical protein
MLEAVIFEMEGFSLTGSRLAELDFVVEGKSSLWLLT